MGKKKKKARKAPKKQLKKDQKAHLRELAPAGCKTKCCEKYQKSEKKRCKRCPCFDLLKEVA